MTDADGRIRAVEEDVMDLESVLAGEANGSITTSANMSMDMLLDRFPAFGDLSIRAVSGMIRRNVDFIWEWTASADADGRFSTWKEMCVRKEPPASAGDPTVETKIAPVRRIRKKRTGQ